MASTYTPIATTTVSSSSGITFSSIPNTYTDLIVVYAGVCSSSATMFMQLNSDTGTNYSYTIMYGDGTNAVSARANQAVANGKAYIGYPSTNQATIITNINNYSNTTTYKTIMSRSSDASSYVTANINLWSNTSAINTVYLYPSGGTLTGTATLYGIKAA